LTAIAKKNRVGTKAQIRAEKEREKRIARAVFLTIILLAAAFSVYFGYSILNTSPAGSTGPAFQFKLENSSLKAAIVDQLSLNSPNQTFVQTVTQMLEQANYSVDYYSSEQVTVDFYRNLATQGYNLIILRVHSTSGGYPAVYLFTSEPYSTSEYVDEQLTDKLVPIAYSNEEAERGIRYFGISPAFVESSMNGKFTNTVVIMMGCEGLKNTKMAEAFIQKGAEAYIGWNSSVSSSHTDEATTHLMQHLVTEGQTINQALTNTINEVGPDPDYNNTLEYYPSQSGNYRIQN
jgi:hypothetical protein